MTIRSFAWAVAVALISFVCVSACDRQDARAVAPYVAPIVRATCVLVRALSTDGNRLEACATAEELAPFIEELLSARERSPARAESSGPILAFALTAPRRAVARRKCERWVTVSHDADGGSDVAR